MSHEIDTMFSVRERPWHINQTGDRTNVVTDYPENWDEARRMAGIMWEPRKVPVYGAAQVLAPGVPCPAGHVVVAELPDGGAVVQKIIEDYALVERDDTGAGLAIVRKDLPLIGNGKMGELSEAFTELWRADGARCRYETAGSLKGGAFVWSLVMLDEPFEIPGDDSATYPYGLLINSHDGKGACKFVPTTVRVVCWNTMSMADAIAEGTGHQVVIRHTGDTDLKIEQAKETLAAIRANSLEWQTVATQLAKAEITDSIVADFVDDFIPMPDGATERMRNSRTEARARFMGLYTSPATGVPGTAYGLFQAATEYLDHVRKVQDADTYLTRTLVKPQPAKAKALAKIRELVPALAA